MINIKLKYKRGLFWRILNVDYPEKWEDLTWQQFIDIVNVVMKGEITEMDKIFIFNSILGTKKIPLFNFPEQIANLNDFIFEVSEPFDKWFITFISHRTGKFFGPDSKFSNIKFGEFTFADTFFLTYLKTGDERLLSKLIAVLYRPAKKVYDINDPDYDGDIRERFNENILEYRANLAEMVLNPVRQAILFNYRMMRKWIETQYPHVFGQEDSGREKTIKLGKSSEPGWDKYLRALCQGDITKLDLVADQLMHNVLAEAEDSIIESLKDK